MDILMGNKKLIAFMVLLIYFASTYHKPISNGVWIIPATGSISQEYKGELHHGIDIACSIGEQILASSDGEVSFTGNKGVYGNTVMLSHRGGVESLYGHNSRVLVKVGDIVKQGDVIALAGNTGKSTGSHCHWEIRKEGVCVNPMDYIAK